VKKSIKTGMGFGFTSAIITILGSMIGLYFGTFSHLAVIGGVLTIAIADAFSDAMGIHISKELEKDNTRLEVWEATLTTFISKCFVGLTFVIPVLIFDLKKAIIISVFYGVFLLVIFSYFIAKSKNAKPFQVIIEYVFIVTVVLVLSQLSGYFIRRFFI
jgi:vacuolar iron transporter family protein